MDTFYGLVYDSDSGVTMPMSLHNMFPDGLVDGLAIFQDDDELVYDDMFINQDSTDSIVHLLGDDAILTLQDSNDTGAAYFKVFDKNSDLIVSMNQNNSIKFLGAFSVADYDGSIAVNGSVNADNYYLDGAPITFRMSDGDIFLRSTYGVTETSAPVYYDDGYVSIGLFDAASTLELQATYMPVDDDVATRDPVISFGLDEGDDTERYTMGSDADSNGQFLIEYGDTIGSSTPLLAIQRNFVSVRNRDPEANLHVSGNLGCL